MTQNNTEALTASLLTIITAAAGVLTQTVAAPTQRRTIVTTDEVSEILQPLEEATQAQFAADRAYLLGTGTVAQKQQARANVGTVGRAVKAALRDYERGAL